VIYFNGPAEDAFRRHIDGSTPGLGLLEKARQWTVCRADGDGDGALELAAASGNLVRFIYMPPGGDVPQATRQYNSPDPGEQILGCAFADVAGGREAELILFEGKTGTVRAIGPEDATAFSIDAGKTEFRGFATPDLNGDGKREILLKGGSRIGVWLSGRGTTDLVEAGAFESRDKESYLLDLAAGDVNSDGGRDVVLVDSGQGSLIIVSEVEGSLKHSLKFRVFEEKLFEGGRGGKEPHGVAVRDLTGDGKEDIVILVHDKIIIYPQS